MRFSCRVLCLDRVEAPLSSERVHLPESFAFRASRPTALLEIRF
jgi:hypothetical protein